MKSYRVLLASAEILCKPSNILSSQIYNFLIENNHKIVTDIENVDYVIVNSCGFDKWHEEFSLYLINMFKTKKKISIIVIGCLNKINKKLVENIKNIRIIENLDDLDNIFFTHKHFSQVTSAIEGVNVRYLNFQQVKERVKLRQFEISIMKMFLSNLKRVGLGNNLIEQILEEYRPQNNILVKIGSGCAGNCSYCIIKRARGAIKSRTIEEIIQDIKSQIDYRDSKRIYLVSDDCGCYGLDINRGTNLIVLLKELHEKFPKTTIDICYLSPNWLIHHENEYLDLIKIGFINSINITLQSGSEKILKLMNRRYQPKKIYSIIKKIRILSPHTIIWTHLLVGFPGETIKDYLQTSYSLLYYDHAFVFAYSDRPGTKSSLLQNKTPLITIFLREKFLGLINLSLLFFRIIKIQFQIGGKK